MSNAFEIDTDSLFDSSSSEDEEDYVTYDRSAPQDPSNRDRPVQFWEDEKRFTKSKRNFTLFVKLYVITFLNHGEGDYRWSFSELLELIGRRLLSRMYGKYHKVYIPALLQPRIIKVEHATEILREFRRQHVDNRMYSRMLSSHQYWPQGRFDIPVEVEEMRKSFARFLMTATPDEESRPIRNQVPTLGPH